MRKGKNSAQRLFSQSATAEAVQPQQPERSRHAASLDLHSASQHHAALALIREQLCFISIYFVRLLTRCALRSLFPYIISACQRFHGNTPLSDRGETCIMRNYILSLSS